MKQHRKSYPVRVMCCVLDVTHSGFYVWLNAVPSQRKMANLAHVTAVKAAHEQTRKTYGTRRLHKELQDQGHEISQWNMTKKRYATRADARDDITEYIEVFYNRQRRHSRLNDVAPVAFYKQFYAQEQIIAEATCA